MLGRRIARFIGPFLALFVFSIAIIGRIPTEKCHCHERKQTTSEEQKPCPFGQLRSLSAGLVVPAPHADGTLNPTLCEVLYTAPTYQRPAVEIHLDIARARGPPAFIDA